MKEARSILAPGAVYRVGDIVTYHQNDRHRIIDADDDMIEVECIDQGDDPVCELGERQWNLCRRFEHLPAIDLLRAIDERGE